MEPAASRPELIEGFTRFAEAARALVALESAVPARDETLSRFKAFAATSADLLLGDARRYVAWLSEAIRPLEPALACVDILRIAGVTHDEDRYTELLAWLLWPGDPGLAAACQAAWVGRVSPHRPTAPVRPRTQVWTDDGIPDLVLAYPGRPLVVEAKTRTPEHPVRGCGDPQTIAYPAAIRRTLGLHGAEEVDVVFLTMDRSAAANAAARAVSWLETAQVLASAVEAEAPPPPLLQAYRTVLGHLAAAAVPRDLDMADVLDVVRAWRRDPDQSVAPHRAALNRCEDLLPRSPR